jgi:hypothetical protein
MAESAAASLPAHDAYARLLSSFVPALMLNEMDDDQTAIEPPTAHEHKAVALFAVRDTALCYRPTGVCHRGKRSCVRIAHAQDISGFSALNEHFAKQGGDGLGQMMSLVNMYFQQMIKITSSCGGDVVKFAGDALIVLFTHGDRSTQAHRACECGMELQDKLHDTPMTETIRLSLKVRSLALAHSLALFTLGIAESSPATRALVPRVY